MWQVDIRLTAFAERHFLKIVLSLLGVYAIAGIMSALGHWRQLMGFEPEFIAQSLATGHGYSFDGTHHWLFEPGTADQYFPSAWSDPLFTALYAAAMMLFGPESRLLIVLLLLACFLAAAALAALTARRIAGPWAGLITLVLLVASVRGTAIAINASLMAGFWVSLLLFYLVERADRLNLRDAVALGALLGLSILTWSSTMIFAPVLVLLLCRFAPATPQALTMSAAMVVMTVLLVAPWSLRNYLMFDELVPVRNGLGLVAHTGTVGLAKTFAPERVSTPVPPPWTSSGPFEAVGRVVGLPEQDRIMLEQGWREQVMKAGLGPELDRMNEAQRDQWLLREARHFVLANPLLTAQLAVAKLKHFVRSSRLPPMMTAVVTTFGLLVCAVLAFRRKLLLVPVALTVAYLLPFTIIVPYFYRYRYPIEPVIAVLGGVAIWCVVETILCRIRQRFRPPRARAEDRRSGGRSPVDPAQRGAS